jgi:citrate lyase subunit beta/citryl-CoA lyase
VTTTPVWAWRSLLFVPGGRPDLVAKAPRWCADAIVIDLEDAIAPPGKDAARSVAVAAINDLGPLARTAILVRVNPAGTPWWGPDLAALSECRADGVVLPKLSSVWGIEDARRRLAAVGRSDALLLGGIETAAGVANARVLIAEGLTAAYFGAEDYTADVGGRRTPAGLEVLYARSEVCLAARLAGVAAIDQAVIAVSDQEHFRVDAEAGRAIGYGGKICIHPAQVALAHQVFTPSVSEISHARAVLAAASTGVAVVDGEMVDEVHVGMARAVLRRPDEPA